MNVKVHTAAFVSAHIELEIDDDTSKISVSSVTASPATQSAMFAAETASIPSDVQQALARLCLSTILRRVLDQLAQDVRNEQQGVAPTQPPPEGFSS